MKPAKRGRTLGPATQMWGKGFTPSSVRTTPSKSAAEQIHVRIGIHSGRHCPEGWGCVWRWRQHRLPTARTGRAGHVSASRTWSYRDVATEAVAWAQWSRWAQPKLKNIDRAVSCLRARCPNTPRASPDSARPTPEAIPSAAPRALGGSRGGCWRSLSE